MDALLSVSWLETESTVALYFLRRWQLSRGRVNLMNGHLLMGHVLGWKSSFKSHSLSRFYGQFDLGINQVADVPCCISQLCPIRALFTWYELLEWLCAVIKAEHIFIEVKTSVRPYPDFKKQLVLVIVYVNWIMLKMKYIILFCLYHLLKTLVLAALSCPQGRNTSWSSNKVNLCFLCIQNFFCAVS